MNAHGFPSDLDGHPLLGWMGTDWVAYVALRLQAELRKQDPGTELVEIGCTGAPEMDTAVGDDGVSWVSLRIPVRLLVRDGSGAEHELDGLARFGGPEPRTTALEIEGIDTWSCRVCDADAGSLELHPDGGAVRVSGTDVERELTETLRAALDTGDAAAIHAVDPALAPWLCPECGACYCAEHWSGRRCPEGHERG